MLLIDVQALRSCDKISLAPSFSLHPGSARGVVGSFLKPGFLYRFLLLAPSKFFPATVATGLLMRGLDLDSLSYVYTWTPFDSSINCFSVKLLLGI